MSPVGKGYLLKQKNGFSINSVHKTAAAVVSDFGRVIFCCGRGGCGYSVTMVMVEDVGIFGGRKSEGF